MKPFSLKEMSDYVTELKRSHPCVDCVAAGRDGIWPACAMQFDHVPERGQKLAGIANWKGTFDELETELAKCDLVCANCHAVRTLSRKPSNETRERMSRSQRGRKHGPETLKKIGEVARRYHANRKLKQND